MNAEVKHIGWKVQDLPCPFCGSSSRRFIGRRGGTAHRDGYGVVTNVVCCRVCGCYYTNPTLVPDGNPYTQETPEEYFCIHEPESKRKTGRRLANFAEKILGCKGSLLEVGCGRGELLEGAMDEGWEVFGIEMTHSFAAIAESRGIVVERSPVETARALERRQFDVILFAAVLEHLYQPAAVLRRARIALPKGGLIFIDVPNEGSLSMKIGNLYMRLRGRDWSVNLSPTFSPYHVVGFTPSSLSRVLERTGFEVIELTKPRWSNVLPSSGNAIRFLERTGLTVASWFGTKLGMGDGICCWARAV